MDITIKGKGHATLNKNDFIASGGEGQIFAKGTTAFKIYSDPRKMICTDKIRELSVLTAPNIIRPQDLILDGRNHPVGYTMQYVKNSYALCQMFPRAFRERMGIKPSAMLNLIKKLQEIVEHCHSHSILIVDLNEMNFIINDNFDTIYAIDCDSYQTPSFPATAIMESIRDRHSKRFSKETDWFSFGIISFQMQIGIHPYKGKHPKFKTLDERMEKNISVLNDAVSMPGVCYPLTNIPQIWREWYKAIFENGKRLPPPSSGTQQAIVVTAVRVKVLGSNNFVIKKLIVLPEDIITFDSTTRHTITERGVYTDSKLEFDSVVKGLNKPPLLAQTSAGKTIAAWLENSKVRLFDLSHGRDIQIDLTAEKLMSYNGRIYAKNVDKLLEILFVETPSTTFVSPVELCQIMPNATKLFEGVAFQDVLGSCYAAICPQSKHCYIPHLKELDGHRICDAKFDEGVLMVVSYFSGKYQRTIFRFDEDYSNYDIYRIDNDSAQPSINFVTLPTGVVIAVDNVKEEMEIFSAVKGTNKSKAFSDNILDDLKLLKDGTQVCFAKNGEMYSIKVKP